MLTLTENLKISSIEETKYHEKIKGLMPNYTYNFYYKDLFISVYLQYQLKGFTNKDNIGIFEFIYAFQMKKWTKSRGCNIKLEATTPETLFYFDNYIELKKHVASKRDRKIILKFIERRICKYCKETSPSIILCKQPKKGKISPISKIFFNVFYKNKYICKKTTLNKFKYLFLSIDNEDYHVFYRKKKYAKQISNVIH